MCDSYDSDNDGDELCTRDVNHSWNPEGVIMPSVFSNPKAILAAVDDLAISLNKEVNLCAIAPAHSPIPAFYHVLLRPVSYFMRLFVAFAMAGAARWLLKGLCV